MEVIVDPLIRQGDSEALSKLPQIPSKFFTNLRLAPLLQSNVQMTVQQEAPQQGASTTVYFLTSA